MRIAPIAVVLASALALAACEEETALDAAPAETGGEAAGDVLEGTISDDMLPLEELTSTSPPAEPIAGEDGAPSSNTAANAPATESPSPASTASEAAETSEGQGADNEVPENEAAENEATEG